MTKFRPIIARDAVCIVEAAGLPDGRRILADFAAAGLTKAYAQSIETIEVAGTTTCVRGSAIPADLWKRIIREGVVDDVWTGGTVRLQSSGLIGGLPEVLITSIGYNADHVERVADQHGGDRAKRAPSLSDVTVADEPDAPAPQSVNTSPDVTAIPDGALLVTVKQACAALGLGRTKVNELMQSGMLVRVKIDGATRIDADSIRMFAQSRP